MKEYILILLIIAMVIKMYLDSDKFQLKCIISSVDNNEYCVRDREKLNDVADLFARISIKCKKLIEHLKTNDKKSVQRLVKKFNPERIVEILPTSKYTAYSENKGEKIALCATTKKHGSELIDENTLMFVALHELAHVMTVSIGHTEEYWNNFKYLIGEANKINIYKPVDYSEAPKDYCGDEITDSPFFS